MYWDDVSKVAFDQEWGQQMKVNDTVINVNLATFTGLITY